LQESGALGHERRSEFENTGGGEVKQEDSPANAMENEE
jgi:hypothetical protein